MTKMRDFLVTRAQSYRLCFEGPRGQTVLRDLAKFCRANKTTYHNDPRLSEVLEGRREVWLRIQEHLRMTDDELWDLHKVDNNG